ncbi:unnamed protein product [Prorocentrum cordatum]|uniref:Cation/H+ exchanger domain-containing protein n=1 Tax=Prorocentrum cordatum TaxID=2364126 RepID=A0ABN9T0H3_9DINO|nr:unnamed protein product [Polarella glacialis]
MGRPLVISDFVYVCSTAQRSAAQRRARAAAARGVTVARSEVEQLKAKVELIKQSRTADSRAQQASMPLTPYFHVPNFAMSSPNGYGRSGRHSWFMRSWMLAWISAHWCGIKKATDWGGIKKQLVAESAGSAEQEQDLAPVLHALEVAEYAVEPKEHAAAPLNVPKALGMRCACGALVFSSCAEPSAGAPRGTGTPWLAVKKHFEFRSTRSGQLSGRGFCETSMLYGIFVDNLVFLGLPRHVPESGVAMLFGFAFGIAVRVLDLPQEESILVFKNNVFFYGLLPPIIFEAGTRGADVRGQPRQHRGVCGSWHSHQHVGGRRDAAVGR